MLLFIFLKFLQISEATKLCQSNVCLNGGICEVDEVERSFKCICPRGFSGTLCEVTCNLDCKNGGRCIADSGKQICKCPEDFTGDLCEVGTIDCLVQGCAPDERCIKRSSGSAICIRDECIPNPCLYNGTCSLENDKAICDCIDGLTGKYCESDIDECQSNPCKNEAKCENSFGSFSCICKDFFTGRLCEQSNFCAVNPCLNGGTCQETENGYECICPSSYTGLNCLERINLPCNCSDKLHKCVDGECVCPNGIKKEICDREAEEICSCVNGGKCENGSLECQCLPGFYGQHCEFEKPCTVNGKNCVHGRCLWTLKDSKCVCDSNYTGELCDNIIIENVCDGYNCNTGKCRVERGRAVCDCPPNTSGDFCEIKRSCPTDYCLNEGHCTHNITDNNTLLSCICKEPFAGPRCEFYVQDPLCENKCADSEICIADGSNFTCQKVKNECNDCENSFHCLKLKNGSVCICNLGWTGHRCNQKIKGCEVIKCKSPRVCRETTNQNGKVTYCGCTPGLRDQNCWKNTAVTLHSHSFFLHQMQDSLNGSQSNMYSLSFSFRTTVRNTRIMVAENILGQTQFSVELRSSYLMLSFPGNYIEKISDISFNDDRWFTVVIINTKNEVSLEVSEADHSFYKRTIPIKKNLNVFLLRFGKGREEGFKGCIRDVVINDENIDLTSSTQSFGIVEGCQRTKQCYPNPCQNHGSCIDNWDSFTCNCKRPYLPPYCINRFNEVTFAYQNESSVIEVDTTGDADEIKLKTDISFLVRTNRQNSYLFYIGEEGSEDIGTFISMEIIDGMINIKTRLGGKKVFSKKLTQRIDDNKEHFINLNRLGNNFTINIDNTVSDEFVVDNRFEHPLLADILVIGNRQNVRNEAFDSDNDFKGSLLDFRVNDMIVALEKDFSDMENKRFGTIRNEMNILNGTVSDDVCSQINPCSHGICENTFNDYVCICDIPWMGRNCDKQDFCSLSPCIANATCTNFHGGYICTRPVSFFQTSSVVFDHRSGSLPADELKNNINFSIRTRSTFGQIFYLKMIDGTISVYLNDGKLVIETTDNTDVRVENIFGYINDGQWHSINITSNAIAIDEDETKIPDKKNIALHRILNSSNSTLVVGKRGTQRPSFQGCLNKFSLGSLPTISFLDENSAGVFPSDLAHFFAIERINIRDDGCISEEVCHALNPCKNGATCKNEWNKYFCECLAGFNGELCEENIDDCKNNKCINGNCIDGINNYSCVCDADFTGQFCDRRIDFCDQIECLNDGTCNSINGTFNCECPPTHIGSKCQAEVSTKCERNPCENGGICKEKEKSFVCKCSPDFDGDLCDRKINHCRMNPCKNGATCTSLRNSFKCSCPPGYTGSSCDALEDNCANDPCIHGNCTNAWLNYVCKCSDGWQGAKCDIDVDECLFYPCENNGICSNLLGSFKCSCPSYYFGDHCEMPGSCVAKPCGTNGECLQLSKSSHSCNCSVGFTGQLCDQQIDYCSLSPCENGGTCANLIGAFNCSCIPGFTGETCQIDIDECEANVCKNGGFCIDQINGFDCDCNGTGYGGPECTEDIDECALGLCFHGICENTNGSFICDCEEGYIGKKCNVENPCSHDSNNNTRNNCEHGECVRPTVYSQLNGIDVARYECDCHSDYTGLYCSNLDDKIKSASLLRLAGPIIALLLASVLFASVLCIILMLRGHRGTQGSYSPSAEETITSRLPMNSILKTPPEERLI